jgi:hypothetical protein
MIFSNSVHRVVFGWAALDHMRRTYRKRENTNSWTKEIFMDFLNFHQFLLEFLKEFQSLQGGQIFDFKFFDGICMKSLINFLSALWNIQRHIFAYIFFYLLGQGLSTKSIKPFSTIFHIFFFFWDLSFESAAKNAKINDRFWATILNGSKSKSSACFDKKSLFVLISWPQTVSSENQEKIVLLGHFLVFF